MESMSAFIIFVTIGLTLLQVIMIIKFFQMASDTREIKELLQESKRGDVNPQSKQNNDVNPNVSITSLDGFNIGDLVVLHRTGKQMRIQEIKDGYVACYTQAGARFEGNFTADEIRHF